ncbi:MAG: dimethylargininase, partial [Proteobacteria bacterium]|nr:dimethylargininase [Pseudomonadota bacterium]
MPLIALTHEISPDIADGQRTWIDRESIDLARADQQHLVYRQTLESLGVVVKHLNLNRNYPDSVFMEDLAVVVD